MASEGADAARLLPSALNVWRRLNIYYHYYYYYYSYYYYHCYYYNCHYSYCISTPKLAIAPRAAYVYKYYYYYYHNY